MTLYEEIKAAVCVPRRVEGGDGQTELRIVPPFELGPEQLNEVLCAMSVLVLTYEFEGDIIQDVLGEIYDDCYPSAQVDNAVPDEYRAVCVGFYYVGGIAAALATATPETLNTAMNLYLNGDRARISAALSRVGMDELLDASFEAGTRFARQANGQPHGIKMLKAIAQNRRILEVFVRQAVRAKDAESCWLIRRVAPEQDESINRLIEENCRKYGYSASELSQGGEATNGRYARLIASALRSGVDALPQYEASRNGACLTKILKAIHGDMFVESMDVTKSIRALVTQARHDGFDYSPFIIETHYSWDTALDHEGEVLSPESQIQLIYSMAKEKSKPVLLALLGSFTPKEISCTPMGEEILQYLAGHFGPKAYMPYIRDRAAKTRFGAQGLNL